MAHGTPDWGQTAGVTTTYQLTDLAELAARLGSPDTWDRRGDIIWFDRFECGLAGWVPSTIGTGASVTISTARARSGRRSALLTAGSDSARIALIRHSDPLPPLSRFGVEVWVSMAANVGQVLVEFIHQSPTQVIVAELQADLDAGKLQYYGSDANFHDIVTGFGFVTDASLFHVIKLVVDSDLNEYVRALVDGVEYDLSGIGLQVAAGADFPYNQIEVIYKGRVAHNDQTWVDNVIYTQNEP